MRTMIEALQDQLAVLRAAYADALIEGKVTQAEHLLKAVHNCYDRLADLSYCDD